MMGEVPELSSAESRLFVEKVCKRVAGTVPAVVGVSRTGFSSMKEPTEAAIRAGASGVTVASPPTLRTDGQIVDDFQMTDDTLGPAPLVLQDFPLATEV